MTIKPAMVALALIAGTVASAAPALADPDITGQWVIDTAGKAKLKPEDMPLTPAALARAKAAAARSASGRLQSEGHIKCLPDGMPHMMAAPFAVSFLQTKGRITVLAEVSNLPRTIYLTEKNHPADMDASWNGHSIGHWEGQTLLVDTVGFNDRFANLFNAAAQVQRTANLHIREKIYVEEKGAFLVDELTLEDPDIFTRPYTVTYRYRRLPADSEVMESVCEVDAKLLDQFEADQIAQASPAP
ncbi:MAG TPA: hypothetical protein VF475_14005 [Sphingobium sp.]